MLAPPLLAGAEELEAVLDKLAALEPAFLTTDERREALMAFGRLSDRLHALHGRVIAAAGDVAGADGHRDVASWLSHRTHRSGASTRRAERLARACDLRWHHLGAALVDGAVSTDQAHVVAAALDDLVSARDLVDCTGEEWGDLIARAETHLVEQAAHFGPRELRRLGARLLAVLAPEQADRVEERLLADAERRARATTTLALHPLGDGTTRLAGRIPDAVATRLRTALEAYTNPRRDPDRLSTAADGDRVPYPRRLGQAFCALLEHLDPARLPLHGGDATTLLITLDLATLTEGLGTAALPGGSRLSPGEVRRLACTADLVPAVLGTDSVPLDLGRSSRLFNTGQRKALALRDRQCRAAGCTIPATWCEAHHLTPWSAGGRTDLANAVLLCSRHHHHIHDDRYLHDRLPNGEVRFTRRT